MGLAERLELQAMLARWRGYQCANYADGKEDGMRTCAYELEDFLCVTDN